ncbi:MAG TPA: CHAP domain-containing protein [Ktedonobacterales bacterium]
MLRMVRAPRAQVWLLSAALVAICAGDFTPSPQTALAAPAATVAAATSLCVRAQPLRRGQWSASADAAVPLASAQSETAMPAQVCVEFFRDVPTEARWQWRTARPALTLQVNIHTPRAATVQNGSGGGGGGGYIGGGDPCAGSRAIVWTIAVWQWAVPAGCFGGIYTVNPYAYGVETSDYGWCAWWAVAMTHNNNALNLPRHSAPRVGAVMWFAPGNQGAGSDGHWAYVESIGPNGWLLISEMNDDWRGGGWARINYRYVRVTSGNAFLY